MSVASGQAAAKGQRPWQGSEAGVKEHANDSKLFLPKARPASQGGRCFYEGSLENRVKDGKWQGSPQHVCKTGVGLGSSAVGGLPGAPVRGAPVRAPADVCFLGFPRGARKAERRSTGQGNLRENKVREAATSKPSHGR